MDSDKKLDRLYNDAKPIRELQLEVDVLKETIEVLKKDLGADLTRLSNRKKAVIIGALEKKYALPMLLVYFHIAKSSYYYQKAVLSKPDKYICYREKIKQLFRENRSVIFYLAILFTMHCKYLSLLCFICFSAAILLVLNMFFCVLIIF